MLFFPASLFDDCIFATLTLHCTDIEACDVLTNDFNIDAIIGAKPFLDDAKIADDKIVDTDMMLLSLFFCVVQLICTDFAVYFMC